MSDSGLLEAVAAAIRASDKVYTAVDAFYRDRGIDADAEDVARALIQAADELEGRS